jgi:prepilin-type N-terminal cleavage/methylation domain-containing protein
MRSSRSVWFARTVVRPGQQRGITLTELLIAVAVSATLLAGTVPWVWSAARTARSLDARAQAASVAAYAARTLRDELEMATELLPPPAGVSSDRGLQVRHDHPGQDPEFLMIVWDPARRVIWRKTSSTYVADNVAAFSIERFGGNGEPLIGNDAQSLAQVARIRFSVTISIGGQSATVVADVLPRAFSS